MILVKSQVHLPQHKIGLIEFQTLHLFCRAEMLSSLLLFKIGLSLIYYDIYIIYNPKMQIKIIETILKILLVTIIPPKINLDLMLGLEN